MGEAKQIKIKKGEDVTIITPHGEIRINVEDRGSNCWAWDDDKWKGADGKNYAIPKPGLIDIRGEEVLYFVLTNRRKDFVPNGRTL